MSMCEILKINKEIATCIIQRFKQILQLHILTFIKHPTIIELKISKLVLKNIMIYLRFIKH